MPLTPDMRRSIDQIRDYLFGGGYPDPVGALRRAGMGPAGAGITGIQRTPGRRHTEPRSAWARGGQDDP